MEENVKNQQISTPKKRGRPTKFNKELCGKAIQYLETEFKKDEPIPTIAGLALFLKIPRQKIYIYSEQYEDFRDIVENLLALQEKRLLTGALMNKLNAKISALMLAKHGYVTEAKQQTNVKIEQIEELSKLTKQIMEEKYEEKYDEPKGDA